MLTWGSLAQALANETGWDVLDLHDLRADDPFLESLGESFPSTSLQILQRGSCPRANIEGGTLALLDRLSPKVRKYGRRLLRQLDEGQIDFRVADSTDQSQQMFDDLVDLHERRWKEAAKPGAFSSAPFVKMHQNLLNAWTENRLAYTTGLYRPDGRALAVLYGFVVGTEFHFYQSGVDHGATDVVDTPGTALILRTIDYLANTGIMRFDFLRGSQPYKLKHSTEEVAMARLVVRRTWSAKLAAPGPIQQWLRRWGKRVLK